MQMAQRRMINKKIISTDDFIDMTPERQCLYFHLIAEADDEGFISSPKMIVRGIGCSNESLEELIEKDYLILFDSGIVVIKHWKVHNYVATDRFTKTIYKKERSLLELEDGVYSLKLVKDKEKTEIKKTKKKTECIPYNEIIDYLNYICKKNYKYTTEKTKSLIKSRWSEGFKLEDFKTVIDKKAKDKYFVDNDYLRPETLFSTKFESYLNSASISDNLPDWFDKKSEKELATQDEINEMCELLSDYK